MEDLVRFKLGKRSRYVAGCEGQRRRGANKETVNLEGPPAIGPNGAVAGER